MVVDSWLGDLSGENTWWTVKFAGTCLSVSGCGDTQEEHLSEVAHEIHEVAEVE